MSKKERMINADDLLANLSNLLYQQYASSYGDALTQAINNIVNQSLYTFTHKLIEAVSRSIAQNTPCLLCREDDNIPNFVENYGDWRVKND
jgi:hypothetical protein